MLHGVSRSRVWAQEANTGLSCEWGERKLEERSCRRSSDLANGVHFWMGNCNEEEWCLNKKSVHSSKKTSDFIQHFQKRIHAMLWPCSFFRACPHLPLSSSACSFPLSEYTHFYFYVLFQKYRFCVWDKTFIICLSEFVFLLLTQCQQAIAIVLQWHGSTYHSLWVNSMPMCVFLNPFVSL